MKKLKKLNLKKFGLVFLLPVLLLNVGFACFQIGASAEQINSEIDLHTFKKDNQDYYTKMVAKEVPTFETKDNKTQQMVVVVDFHAHVHGGEQHIVTCKNNGKDCDKPEGRKLTLLKHLSKEQRQYYQDMLKN